MQEPPDASFALDSIAGSLPSKRLHDSSKYVSRIYLYALSSSTLVSCIKELCSSDGDFASLRVTGALPIVAYLGLLINAEYQVLIEGHADEQGTRDYNLALGARRAQIVKEYLISRGVDPNNISIVTYGKERPLENCSAEVCWSQNRRAVTIVNALSKG